MSNPDRSVQGRPSRDLWTEHRSQTTRAIVEAFVGMLHHDNPATISMPKVAAAAGISTRTLYRYFPDKDSLMEAASGWFDVDARDAVGGRVTHDNVAQYLTELWTLLAANIPAVHAQHLGGSGRELRRRRLERARRLRRRRPRRERGRSLTDRDLRPCPKATASAHHGCPHRRVRTHGRSTDGPAPRWRFIMRRAGIDRRLIGVGVVAALAISMAACGGGDDASDETAPPAPPATAAPTTEATTAPPTTEPAPETTPAPAPETTEADAPDPLPESLELVWTLELDDVLARPADVALDPNGDLVVIGSAVGYVHHLADGELVDVIRYWASGPASLAFSPDGSIVGAGFLHGRVALTTADGAAPAGMVGLAHFDDFDGAYLDAGSFNTTVAFTPDGERLVTSSRSGLIEVWDLPGLDVVGSFEAPDADERTGPVSLMTTVLAVQPSGELVGAVNFDCHLNVWNIDTGAVVHSFPLERIGCSLGRTFAFSPDGAVMAAVFADSTGDQVVRLWDVDDATVVADLPVGAGTFNDLSFSPDSTMLVTSVGGVGFSPAVIWDVATATVLHEVGDASEDESTATERGGLVVARFTPDGGHVLVGDAKGVVELWRLPGADELVPPERQPCDPVPIPGDVLFDTGSAALRPDADAVLADLAEQLADTFPVATLTFVGHTDSRGSDDANRQLSLERATSVRDWFTTWAASEGTDGWVLEIDGLGASQPRVPDLDADGNFLPDAGAVNRRVEIGIDAEGCAP